MADNVTKLNTRIISKHITLDQANTGTWKPYEGEIVLARVDTQKPDGHGGLITVPTYLMKVGAKWPADSTEGTPGELMPINKLQWTHAPASDVYAWAKQQKLAITTSGDGNVISNIEATDAGITITKTNVATTESITTINGAIEALQGALAQEVTDRTNADTTLDNKITEINNNLNGTTEGGIGKRLTAVEGVASGAASKAEQNATNLTNYKAEMVETLKDKVDVSTYDTKMAQIDTAISTTLPGAITEASNGVKSAVIGASGDAKTADTIYGAKAHADDVATTKASAAQSAAEATAASALSTAKTELQGNIDDLGDTVEANEIANASAHKTFSDDIAALKEKVTNVTNVMDFVGVASSVTVAENGTITITVDGVTAFQKGDVVVSTAGKEYVYDGSAWHEFGSTTATDAAIVEVAEDLAEFIGTTAPATYVNKTDYAADVAATSKNITDLDTAYKKAVADLKTELSEDISEANTDAYDRAVAEAARLDGVQTTAITEAYEKAVSDAKTAIETAQSAVDTAQNTKITALEDEVNGKDDVKGLRTLITEEAARADAAEKLNAAAIKTIQDTYVTKADKEALENATQDVADDLSELSQNVTANKQDVDTNFVKVVDGKATVGGVVIIFDCGGVEEA